MNYADTILYGCSFFAGMELPDDYDYVVLKEGRIVSIGKGEGWKEYVGSETEVIELPPDSLVVPGFHDSHLHLIMAALNYNFVDLADARSEEEAVQMVYEFSKTIPDDPWVVGLNWYHMNWENRQLPTKESLDRYFPDRPVFLTNTEVHGAWVNSKALELVGITDETPDPDYGEIFRDANGEATGYLNEMAMGLAGKYALKFTIAREKELITKVAALFASKGVTAVQDMRPELGYDLGQYEAFAQLAEENALDIRVHSAANLFDDLDQVMELQQKYNSDKFRLCLLKQYLDGVPTTHTAMVTEPYLDAPDIMGEPLNDIVKMQQQVEKAHRHGLSVKIHCCGDRAVKQALDFYEVSINKYGKTASRHAVEHVEIVRPEDVDRFKELGIIASMQPEHMVIQVDRYEENPYFDKYSEKQMETSWNFRRLLDKGVRVAFGTDCPVVGIDPLIGIYRAVTRKFNDGKPDEGMQPSQKITVREALHCYTYNSAFGVKREHELGTLEAGKLADIAVIDKNILNCEPEEIKEAKVLLTLMNGDITYDGRR